MRIKDEIFCFAHLRWCHNGWASNILIVVDTGYAGIHHSKYWMPIHYDTIGDGQNKKSHLLFSKLHTSYAQHSQESVSICFYFSFDVAFGWYFNMKQTSNSAQFYCLTQNSRWCVLNYRACKQPINHVMDASLNVKAKVFIVNYW